MKKAFILTLLAIILAGCGSPPKCKDSQGNVVDCRQIHENDMDHEGNADDHSLGRKK